MRAAPPPQPNPPARRAEGVGRGAERGRRGPVLQGAPVRETAPDRDGGDRGAERLHRAPAQSVCTAMSVRRSSRQAGRTCHAAFRRLKDAGSLCRLCRRSAISRPTAASLCSASARSSPRVLAGRAHLRADRRRRAPPQRGVRPDRCATCAAAAPSTREVRRCVPTFKS